MTARTLQRGSFIRTPILAAWPTSYKLQVLQIEWRPRCLGMHGSAQQHGAAADGKPYLTAFD